jgi:hypothetical protein
VKLLAFTLALALQAPQTAPLVNVRTTLRQLAGRLDEHKSTNGAAPELTGAKHQLRDWIESRLAGARGDISPRVLQATLHDGVRDADLFCGDCDFNFLGYLDDVRVARSGSFLTIVVPIGINCGYDESVYVYGWDGQAWRRVFEHEQATYTDKEYLPQLVDDVQVSAPDTAGRRLIMVLGNQTICGGAFKNLYARVWSLDATGRTERVLNWTGYGNDGIPAIDGRVLPGDVLFEFTAGGLIDGDPHTAIRHFKIDGPTAVQTDPIASRPLDFVLEWLSAPWTESRTRSESAALETLHAQLRRNDAAGDASQPTLRCTAGDDVWQVTTHLYDRPKRYFRVRWKDPYTFTMVGISEMPYPDCTVQDGRGEAYPKLFQ